MRRLLLPFCLALLAGTLSAQDKEERLWTGVNGKTFRGAFQLLSEDRKTAEFLSPDGKTLRVEVEKLVPADRARLLAPEPAADKIPAPVTYKTPEGFKDIPPPSRTPDILPDPLAAGGNNGGPLVDSLWSALMWWDITHVVAVPGRGDLEKKGVWLHKKLKDQVEKGGGNPDAEDVRTAAEQYFATELKGVATCRVTVENKDLSPGYLSRVATGADAVILRMSMTYDNGRDFGVSMILEEMTPEGKFAVVLCGKRLTGEAKPVPKDEARLPVLNEMEWILSNSADLPELYKKNGARFFTRSQTFNAAISIHPLVYAEAGKPVAVPPAGAASSDESAWVEPKTYLGQRKLAPEFPIEFTTPVAGLRDWKTKAGSSLRATVAGVGANQISLKGPGGRTVAVDTRQLTEEDATCGQLWQACQGQPRPLSRLRLTYQLECPVESVEIAISVEGTRGRVDQIMEKGENSLIFDLKDGSFIKRYHHIGPDKDTLRLYTGRFSPENLLPRGIKSRHTQQEIDFFVNTVLPGATEATGTQVPCRRIQFPLSVYGVAYRNPEIDFVLQEHPVVLAALYQVLCTETPGKGAKYHVYNVPQVYAADDIEGMFPILAACKILPLRMTWTNKQDPRQQTEYHRVRAAGKYTVSLKQAAIPASFPPDHFAIPSTARAMEPGRADYKETVTPR